MVNSYNADFSLLTTNKMETTIKQLKKGDTFKFQNIPYTVKTEMSKKENYSNGEKTHTETLFLETECGCIFWENASDFSVSLQD